MDQTIASLQSHIEHIKGILYPYTQSSHQNTRIVANQLEKAVNELESMEFANFAEVINNE